MLKSKASMQYRTQLPSLNSAHLASFISARALFFSENKSLGSASITKSLGSASKISVFFTSLDNIYIIIH